MARTLGFLHGTRMREQRATHGLLSHTETTSRRNELAMESYDRLCPNHDGCGGLGNLIALPLH
jgi:hypothetical protein